MTAFPLGQYRGMRGRRRLYRVQTLSDYARTGVTVSILVTQITPSPFLKQENVSARERSTRCFRRRISAKAGILENGEWDRGRFNGT